MVIIISCVGIIILFCIQFRICKIEERKRIKEFIGSKQFWNVIKDILVIILSITLAINCNSLVEKKQNQDKVIKMLQSVTSEIRMQYLANSQIVGIYNSETIMISAETIQTEVEGNKSTTVLIENILKNDTILATASPIMYGMMLNNMNSVNNSLYKISTDEVRNMISSVRYINRCFENILWAIDAETKHLQGEYSEKELYGLYIQHICE